MSNGSLEHAQKWPAQQRGNNAETETDINGTPIAQSSLGFVISL